LSVARYPVVAISLRTKLTQITSRSGAARTYWLVGVNGGLHTTGMGGPHSCSFPWLFSKYVYRYDNSCHDSQGVRCVKTILPVVTHYPIFRFSGRSPIFAHSTLDRSMDIILFVLGEFAVICGQSRRSWSCHDVMAALQCLQVPRKSR
jgi:hypothetical protein